MLAMIKDKFTAAWKAHFAAIGAGVAAFLLAKFGFMPEPDGAVITAAKTGIGEVLFSIVSGAGAWFATYFSPKNTGDVKPTPDPTA